MRKLESVITRFNICEIACHVYSKALSPENAQSAFTRTSIRPLDRTAIPSESLIPAEVYQDESPDNEVEGVARQDRTQDSVNDGNQGQVENQDYILQMFSSKEAHLKTVKSEKITKPRRTMSKIVPGKEINGDILEKMKEHKNRSKLSEAKRKSNNIEKKSVKKQKKKNKGIKK